MTSGMTRADSCRVGAVVLALAAMVLVAAGGGGPAEAAFPGDNGRIAFTNDEVKAGNPEGDLEIYTMNPDGTDIHQLTDNSAPDFHPAWSADGTKVAFTSNRDGNWEIYKMNADGSNETNVTNNPATPDFRPAWSPDGTQIAFVSDGPDFTYDIFVMNADGTNARTLTEGDPTTGVNSGSDKNPAWSPDGTQIAFDSDRDHRDGGTEIYKMDAVDRDGDGTGDNLTRLSFTPYPLYEVTPSWSPDGTQIAFASNRDGFQKIYKMNAVPESPTNQPTILTDGGEPRWSPDGTQIAFTSNAEIYKMNADGTNQPTNLTNTSAGNESFLDWGVAVAPPDTNKPPVASNDSYSTNQGQPLNEAAPGVLANDTDPEGDTLTAVKVLGPANGTLTLNSDGSFTYTPSSGFSGSDTFTYKAYDGTADSNTVTVTITVNPVDTTAPTVFGFDPSDGQTGVSTTTNITRTFSETMDESTLNDNTVKLVKPGKKPTSIPITMTTRTDGSGRSVLALDPYGSAKQNLAGTTTYQLTIEGAGDTDGFAVRDVASNELARDAVSSFTTAKK